MIEDVRLALFLQTVNGLLLTPEDVTHVLARPGLNPRDLEQALVSPEARMGIAGRPGWFDDSRRMMDQAHANGARWVHCGDEDYPEQWRTMSMAPLVFSYLGAPCWKNARTISVVGSRTPMAETRIWMQRELGLFLKTNAVTVVSGGARGVDQWAHRLAVDYGRPTVCVLPTGLLNPYPFGQDQLWKAILEMGGCLLSTFRLDDPLRKWAFHIRNRWIAGMSRVCFVTEANRRSGSMLTATLATEEGREVCTLPVFPMGEQGLANLDLISNGAVMIRDCRDLEVLMDFSSPTLFESAEREKQKERVH